jgi:hypothetical protein
MKMHLNIEQEFEYQTVRYSFDIRYSSMKMNLNIEYRISNHFTLVKLFAKESVIRSVLELILLFSHNSVTGATCISNIKWCIVFKRFVAHVDFFLCSCVRPCINTPSYLNCSGWPKSFQGVYDP